MGLLPVLDRRDRAGLEFRQSQIPLSSALDHPDSYSHPCSVCSAGLDLVCASICGRLILNAHISRVAILWNGAAMVDSQSLSARILANVAIWYVLIESDLP